MNEEIIYEQESDIPDNWISDIILMRDGKGNIIEIQVPDDKEG